jgi:hypothetical protein
VGRQPWSFPDFTVSIFFRAVGVDDDNTEAAHDGTAECPGRNRKGDQRNDNRQQIAGTVVSKKLDLAQRDQP